MKNGSMMANKVETWWLQCVKLMQQVDLMEQGTGFEDDSWKSLQVW